MVNRLMGVETWTDAVNFGTAAHIFGGAVSFTGTPTYSGSAMSFPANTKLGGYPLDTASRLVTVAAATTQLTVTQALHDGRIIQLQSTAALAVTLPAATGSGACYTFQVITLISGGNVTLDAKTNSAAFYGLINQIKDGSALATYSTTATSNLLTLNGGTTGGLAGDFIEMVDVATNVFNVYGITKATGTVATPISAH
jgi:hypothetical protein